MAPAAQRAVSEAEVIVGYKGYINLIDPATLAGKEVYSTGMRGEIKRCQETIRHVLAGKRTVMVSSGDPGIYAMAGLLLELLAQKDLIEQIKPEVIPGIPALAAGAARLGAPLMNDFAVISLSDLLTPWELIKTRVKAALAADFVLVFYNPRSRKRDWQLREILDMVIEIRGPKTPVGVVKNAAREEESVTLTTARETDDSDIDMFSIVFVGNSNTRLFSEYMVTPRGYPIT
jgi:precorrin-3B C17-methyltransferase